MLSRTVQEFRFTKFYFFRILINLALSYTSVFNLIIRDSSILEGSFASFSAHIWVTEIDAATRFFEFGHSNSDNISFSKNEINLFI